MASIDLAQLLEVCVRAALAAQRYVMLDLVKLPEAEAKMSFHHDDPKTSARPQTVLDLSEADRGLLLASLRSAVNVDVKSHLDYKDGDAAEDLVTTADVLTQAVLTHVLQRTFPSQPFTVVGEEEEPSSALAAEAVICVKKHYDSGDAFMPNGAELRAHLQTYAKPDVAPEETASTVYADSVEALRRRVGVFIDPIDGTNCFYDGVWQAPMTLVGITLDNVPVAAVMNRVFCFPLTQSASAISLHQSSSTAATTGPARPTRCGPSLSFILNAPRLSSPFVVFDGALLPAPVTTASHPPCTPASALLVCHSSTTKEEFLQQLLGQLQPCTAIRARGAGYKQYHLLKKMWAGSAVSGEHITPADAFVCPPVTIKKWDCCAPHAFLYAMGGDIFAHDGAPLRYALARPDGSAGTHTELAALPKGLLAVTPYVKEEVARRMQWAVGST
ncbi:putative mitochondrial inositol polyphosphate 1-phosphatase [Leptomonas pyrrhocoris]|uniref:3'(2'),5'-bisphosphate nucleotidase n=1 Tax=Leptomonas pyrrhocoris TaxID=157538 RepID=A0A0M9FRJ4_LEPPY|nr:putative mitochondrial inositol polyphosphate 1-phosphatase [Leptomonas pyrrhocoris]XP_015652987.1 putative mitochondrial inositol polyphosphate 1-phosphatase [Leptomonas pyrrhocoris]KPA74547.1 putative mitochondrial inositol polyphosphate 1-phosphatase [Leptomonas pyrrhocoris]KPA74548.1 putative mitochondrial inositol polyphosphate 1-phosphatase [Leptomonas pyrrhocoris]|eukprot:XP_015652986.1 putative mitochondrial inositol polyphosphate 1-phosphatase [Leptomonas pyrrhocoris]